MYSQLGKPLFVAFMVLGLTQRGLAQEKSVKPGNHPSPMDY
jgi:hypothetical protein